MLAIKLPAEIENRLAHLAKATGRSKTFYAKEAILNHLDDLEDYYLAAKVSARIEAGDEPLHSEEEVATALGLKD
jgi:RHH-type rel operon transcriptional repressor/antitoxin RelB